MLLFQKAEAAAGSSDTSSQTAAAAAAEAAAAATAAGDGRADDDAEFVDARTEFATAPPGEDGARAKVDEDVFFDAPTGVGDETAGTRETVMPRPPQRKWWQKAWWCCGAGDQTADK